MKKYLIATVLAIPAVAMGCAVTVIAFKGQNNSFDQLAFNDYIADRPNYCGVVYSWNEVKAAQRKITALQVPYQLYGFSKGAVTVHKILKQNLHKPPQYVITIGAYKTVDVDFTKYNIPYDNYFDLSGRGQQSPGIFLNVAHMQMQAAVNLRRVGIVAVP